MAVTIKVKVAGNRRRGFEADVRQVAPLIRECQAAGIVCVRAIAEALNADGVKAPSGRPWSYATMLRVMDRAAALGLAACKHSLSEAARARPVSYAPRSRYDEASSRWIGGSCTPAKKTHAIRIGGKGCP
ncbi:recombinase family protein [Sphingomonas sp. CCH9-F2]|jgi:hypothetical protein|uniref:recombinase family protein n=1 Tax=Sphingomonas sp. CCH9-F2 TaxID=1768778 RepID=UPI003FA74765